jgi:hypothetical protein
MLLRRILILLFSAAAISCAHAQRYEQDNPTYPAQVSRKAGVIGVNIQWPIAVGDMFRFKRGPVLVRYSDGSQVEVAPTILARQFRQRVEEKYPPKDGFHYFSTEKEWVYEIRKAHSDTVANYDATPKTEVLSSGRLYKFAVPDAQYDREALIYSCSFPDKDMEFDLTIPAIVLMSKRVNPPRIHFKFAK